MHGRRRRPAPRYVAAAAAVLVILGSVGGWFLHERNRTTSFGLTDALSVLRADRRTAPATGALAAAPPSAATSSSTPATVGSLGTPTSAGPGVTASTPPPPTTAVADALPVPAAGVYSYATSGYDAISVGS